MPFGHMYNRLKNPGCNKGENWKNEKFKFHEVSIKGFFSYFYHSLGNRRYVFRQKKLGGLLLKNVTFGFVYVLQS